jgi:glycosyltransferase involved in cell wall biosynthesis
MDNNSYAVISPCRDEAEFMRETLESVVNQSIPPTIWVIVDDGSTDETPAILEEYASKYSYIKIVTREDRGERKVGPGVIDAFYDGLKSINMDDYPYLCKLDLDLRLPKYYFSELIKKMESNPRLGTYSGKPYFYNNSGQLVSEKCGDESSVGMTKFYRTTCFKQIGGFVRQVMWDGIDSHRCRRLGWISSSDDRDDLRFIHLRPMGSSQKGIITGRMRHGFGQYYMGTSLMYMLASTIYRLFHPPYFIGSLASLWGYVLSSLNNEERLDDKPTVKVMRAFQWQAMIKGKAKAIKDINSIQSQYWNPDKDYYEIPVDRN